MARLGGSTRGAACGIGRELDSGGAEITMLDDGWAVVTAGGSLSAQFERTIVVTPDGCEVLTAI
jgi:methionyl aminopeptidase